MVQTKATPKILIHYTEFIIAGLYFPVFREFREFETFWREDPKEEDRVLDTGLSKTIELDKCDVLYYI